jgi:hypothetical protein
MLAVAGATCASSSKQAIAIPDPQAAQVATGLVTQVRADELVVLSAAGEPMTFRMEDSTKVQIEGRTSTADEIKEGQAARVAYEPSADGPKAVSIRVGRAAAKPSRQWYHAASR